MELLLVDTLVVEVELCLPDPNQELWASVGVGLPLGENDDTDSQVYLSMAFCTFLAKCVGKESLLFREKLCFPNPSDSPLLLFFFLCLVLLRWFLCLPVMHYCAVLSCNIQNIFNSL